MNSDLWFGAVTTLAGAVLGGAISFLLSRQQLKDARAQRAEEALREKDRRSVDRRFDAYANFHTQARAYRSAIRPYREQSGPGIIIREIDLLAHSADAASSLVFLVQESRTTRKACAAVVRTIGHTLAVIHELDSNLDDVPWLELNDDMARVMREWEAAAREELGVGGGDSSPALAEVK
jgi:hypothetical protein